MLVFISNQLKNLLLPDSCRDEKYTKSTELREEQCNNALVLAAILLSFLPVQWFCSLLPIYTWETSRWSAFIGALDLGALSFYYVLVIMGYIYTSGVTNQRKNVLHNRRGQYIDFFKLLLVTAMLYFCVAQYSLARPTSDFHLSKRHTIVARDYLCFVIPFFFGLHFYYLDRIGPLSRAFYQITWPPIVDPFGRSERVALLGVSSIIFSVALYQIAILRAYGYLSFYLFYWFLTAAILAFLTWQWRHTHYLHLHHYFLGTISLIPFAFRDTFACICQATMLGVTVEGISTWGMETIFDAREKFHVNKQTMAYRTKKMPLCDAFIDTPLLSTLIIKESTSDLDTVDYGHCFTTCHSTERQTLLVTSPTVSVGFDIE